MRYLVQPSACQVAVAHSVNRNFGGARLTSRGYYISKASSFGQLVSGYENRETYVDLSGASAPASDVHEGGGSDSWLCGFPELR